MKAACKAWNIGMETSVVGSGMVDLATWRRNMMNSNNHHLTDNYNILGI